MPSVTDSPRSFGEQKYTSNTNLYTRKMSWAVLNGQAAEAMVAKIRQEVIMAPGKMKEKIIY